MPRILKLTLAGAVVALLAACSSSSHVLVGAKRPPISPDQVKVYFEPPPRYEQIATLDATSSSMFSSDQGKTDTAIAGLKAEAAKLGANGILLQGVEKRQSGSIGLGVGAPATVAVPQWAPVSAAAAALFQGRKGSGHLRPIRLAPRGGRAPPKLQVSFAPGCPCR
jgi:hypothetical protein